MRLPPPREARAQGRENSLPLDRLSFCPGCRRSPRAGKIDVRSADAKIEQRLGELSRQQVSKRAVHLPCEGYWICCRCATWLSGWTYAGGMRDDNREALLRNRPRRQGSRCDPLACPRSVWRGDRVVPAVEHKRDGVRVAQFNPHRKLIRPRARGHAVERQYSHFWRCRAAHRDGQSKETTGKTAHAAQSTRCRNAV